MKIEAKLRRAQQLAAKQAREIEILSAQNINLLAARERDKQTIEGLTKNLLEARKAAEEHNSKVAQYNGEAQREEMVRLQGVEDYHVQMMAGYERVVSMLTYSLAQCKGAQDES